METLDNPDFKNEAEEAAWWADNQDALAEEFNRAASNGTLRRGAAARLVLTPTTAIPLQPGDAELAINQAERQGLELHAYLSLVVHRALLNEAGHGS